jgi:hypothetical protein
VASDYLTCSFALAFLLLLLYYWFEDAFWLSFLEVSGVVYMISGIVYMLSGLDRLNLRLFSLFKMKVSSPGRLYQICHIRS